MHMPGLTADASLYGRGEYRAADGEPATGTQDAIVPQACVNLGPCRVCVTWQWWPPKACLQFSCLGFNRNFCVP